MCITNPSKISDFRENLLHMLLFWTLILFDSYAYSYKNRGSHVQQPHQLYFSRTFQQISFPGYFLAFLDAYQLEGQFFESLKFRRFSIKIGSLKTE